MTVQSIQLSGIDIVGYQQGRSVPPGNVEVTAAQVNQIRQIRAELQAERRGEHPQWDGANSVKPADTRPIFGITADRAVEGQVNAVPVLADGVDEVTVTITAFQADGTTVRTGFAGVRYYEVDDDTWWRITFVAGVGTHVFKTTTTGFREFRSNPRVRLKQEGRILAHE